LRAAIEAELTNIPVEILEIDDDTALTLSLLENLQREDLNKLEETEGILKLLARRIGVDVEEVPNLLYKMKNQEEGLTRGIDSPNGTADETFEIIRSVFATLGRISWQSFIRTRLPLRKLPLEVLEAVRRSQIDYTKALVIASVKDEEVRQELLGQTITQDLSQKEVNERVKSLKSGSSPNLKGEFQKVLKIRSRVWEDPTKAVEIQELMNRLKALLQTEASNDNGKS
jgi:ParB family chromosome partitioning protein